MMRLLALALALVSSNAASVTIAGYVSASDVSSHSEIDLDVQDMDTCLDTTYDFTCATTAYEAGGNSVKSSGAIRTLQGFATSSLDTEDVGAVYYAYWGTNSYADNFITSALSGTTTGDSANTFGTLSSVERMQLAMKGTQYQATWRYVFHELDSAISKCNSGSLDDDSGAPHAWDEGWAFYAGSLEGTAVGGSSSGKLAYRLAEKRCGNFGTCTGTGGFSQVNDDLLTLFQTGLTQSQAGSCTDLAVTQGSILEKMTVPLVQGTLRYAYKCDPAELNEGAEACAEGYAFAAAILPQLDACDSSVAAVVKSEMKTSATTSSMIPSGFAVVKAAIESTYDCLGITCDDVGGLLSTGTDYYSGMEPCNLLSPASHVTPTALAFLVGLFGLVLLR